MYRSLPRLQVPSENRLIILSIDAIAREKMKREMPETLKALRDTSETNDVFGFERYHATGVNTRVNMVPLMTGARDRNTILANYLSHKWLYHVAEDAGYPTMAAGDFCSGLDGNSFKNNEHAYLNWVVQTSGRYPSMNVFPIKAQCEKLYKTLKETNNLENTCTMVGSNFGIWTPTVSCAGHLPTYRHWFDYLRQFLTGSGRRMAHIHNLHYHTDKRQKIPDMDKAYAELIRELAEDDRNILLFVSDHGLAFGKEYPMSLTGWEKIYGEDFNAIHRQFAHQKQPFAYLMFPKNWKGWEGVEGQERRANMIRNTNRLVTHVDMHYTLRYILTGSAFGESDFMVLMPERLTLFDDIGDRSCEQAGLIPQSCACSHAVRKPGGKIPAILMNVCKHSNSGYPIFRKWGFCL